jgi:hypothetical protein
MKSYSIRERVRRALYEKMFDVALYMASRLSEKDRKVFAWLLRPRKDLTNADITDFLGERAENAERIIGAARRSFIFCDHANEVPQACPCGAGCICRSEGSCQS